VEGLALVDLAAAEDVGAETTAALDGFVQAGGDQAFEVHAWGAEAVTDQDYVVDGEAFVDQGVEIDAAGDEISAVFAAGEIEVMFGGDGLDRFSGDERDGAPAAGPFGEAALAFEVSVAFEALAGDDVGGGDLPKRLAFVIGDIDGFDHAWDRSIRSASFANRWRGDLKVCRIRVLGSPWDSANVKRSTLNVQLPSEEKRKSSLKVES
jgi:hypothetical protein